ncbi:hypothetical protein IH980_01425 [Patescibacteria group bacterium]|nr:hypothetical protein [Patescibacteria group bacterium]
MNRYLVVLGRKTTLAFAELQTVLRRNEKAASRISITPVHHTAIVESESELDCKALMAILGGTIKIAVLGKRATSKNFPDRLVTILRNESIGKARLRFGISLVGSRGANQRFLLPKILKARLSHEKIETRFILPRRSNELSSSQVKLVDLTELYVVWSGTDIEIGKTVALQDFEGFANRDYKRPYADPKTGMLPPKVARMMVNLAFPQKIRPTMWLLDPFCGTGTIAMEALMLGMNTVSSDHSHKKVAGTRANLTWLCKEEKWKTKWRVMQGDATKVSQMIEIKVDAIVTEPFLGSPRFTAQKVPDIIKGLNKLYLGALKDWRKCLRKNGRVVMVIPEIRVGNLVKRADLVIDRCENLGYTLVAGPFEYDRPQARVRRQIIVFEKQIARKVE